MFYRLSSVRCVLTGAMETYGIIVVRLHAILTSTCDEFD